MRTMGMQSRTVEFERLIGCKIHRRWEQIENESQLIENVHDIIRTRKGLGGFDDTFGWYGYTKMNKVPVLK